MLVSSSRFWSSYTSPFELKIVNVPSPIGIAITGEDTSTSCSIPDHENVPETRLREPCRINSLSPNWSGTVTTSPSARSFPSPFMLNGRVWPVFHSVCTVVSAYLQLTGIGAVPNTERKTLSCSSNMRAILGADESIGRTSR